jgi:predicted RNA-binding Zn-ribbon protein involved in translation (DUF1610 family)
MQCPNCGRNIDESLFPESLAFCFYCGQDLKPVSHETERLDFCPYCGRELPEQTSFCPHCGKQLKVNEKRLSAQKLSKVFLERATRPLIKAVRDAFSSEKKTRKLFQQWSEYAELPPKEVPSMEALREMPEGMETKRGARWYLAVGIVGIIVIALIIFLVIQC